MRCDGPPTRSDTYASSLPKPPRRVLVKYSSFPFVVIDGERSSTDELILDPTFTGVQNGLFFVFRLAVQISMPPNPPALFDVK